MTPLAVISLPVVPEPYLQYEDFNPEPLKLNKYYIDLATIDEVLEAN